jgi:hypothetical protein
MDDFAVFAFFLALGVIITAPVSATEHVENDSGDCAVGVGSECDAGEFRRAYGERFVEIRELSDSRVEMESKLVNTTKSVEDKFQIYVDTDDSLEVTLRYKNENLSSNEKDIAETSVTFDRLGEYQDSNNNGKLDEDEVVAQRRLKDFQKIELTNYTEDGAKIHEITATTTDNVFEVVFYATGDFANLGSTVVKPSEMKFDVAIEDYGYEYDNTSLALGAEIESGAESDEGTLVFNTGEEYDTFFSWKQTAEIDGKNVDTNVTTFGNKMAISYGEQAENIFHDPKVGFTPSNEDGDSNSIIQLLESVIEAISSILPI